MKTEEDTAYSLYHVACPICGVSAHVATMQNGICSQCWDRRSRRVLFWVGVALIAFALIEALGGGK